MTRRPGRRRPRRKISPPPGAARPPAAGARGTPPPAGARPPAAAAASAAERKDPLLGKVVGRCRLEALIGQGRTARVYRAKHEALGTTVAIKILLPRTAANPELVEKFQEEARAIAKIDNENVLKIYDVGTEGKFHFLVMELLDGEEVLDILNREERLDVLDALRVTRQAANGLAAAHGQGIVHRDVKPQNLVILEDGTVKVVDFGLAGVAQIGGDRVGTPHFMAPETCESGETTTKSDVYSLGISLFHMLTGKPPYAGQDVPSILKSHVRGEPLRPEAKRPGLPREVAELVRKLTLKSPVARPSASQVVEAIDGFGGEAMQEKATLRRRRRRVRAHVAAGSSSSSSSALLFAVFVVVGAIVAIIAFSSGGDEGGTKKSSTSSTRGTDPARGAVPTTPDPSLPTVQPNVPPRDPGTTPPLPPEEPQVDPEEAGNRALFEVEQWARRNWKTTDDDEGVIAQYQKVANNHPKTGAAKEATKRVREIRTHKRHAHPDKEFSEATEVEAVKETWTEVRPQVEALIAKHSYVTAKSLLPKARDGAGTIGKELVFYDGFLTHLIQFKNTMSTWVPKLPERRRQIKTAKGEGLVEKVSPQHLTVVIDGKEEKVIWLDVEPAALASLARAAFQEAPRGSSLYVMAFAFAHHLWEAFWEADFDVGMDEAVDSSDFLYREYQRRVDERKASDGR